MKNNKIIYGIAVFVIAVVATTFSFGNQKHALSAIVLENVDALGEQQTSLMDAGATRYQTMKYCANGGMNYGCKDEKTAEGCRRECPK